MLMLPALIAALFNARWLWIGSLLLAGLAATMAYRAVMGLPVDAPTALWNLFLAGSVTAAVKGVRLLIASVVRRKPDADHAR